MAIQAVMAPCPKREKYQAKPAIKAQLPKNNSKFNIPLVPFWNNKVGMIPQNHHRLMA